jgi:hypothetical protein
VTLIPPVQWFPVLLSHLAQSGNSRDEWPSTSKWVSSVRTTLPLSVPSHLPPPPLPSGPSRCIPLPLAAHTSGRSAHRVTVSPRLSPRIAHLPTAEAINMGTARNRPSVNIPFTFQSHLQSDLSSSSHHSSPRPVAPTLLVFASRQLQSPDIGVRVIQRPIRASVSLSIPSRPRTASKKGRAQSV